MGLLDYVDVPFTKNRSSDLSGVGTQLLKGKKKRKKQRRGSGSKKKTAKQIEHAKLMEQYKKQKRERGQMFQDFNRLIHTD